MGVVNTTFSAISNGGTTEGSDAELIIGGTFVGTVQLQAAIPGSGGADLWVPVGTPLTAPGSLQYKGATGRKYRAACTAFTSGSIFAQLAVVNHINLRQT